MFGLSLTLFLSLSSVDRFCSSSNVARRKRPIDEVARSSYQNPLTGSSRGCAVQRKVLMSAHGRGATSRAVRRDRRLQRDVQGGVAGRPPAAQRAFASELRRRRGGQPRSSGRAFSGGNPPGKQPWHGASMECAPVEVWTRGANHRRRKEK